MRTSQSSRSDVRWRRVLVIVVVAAAGDLGGRVAEGLGEAFAEHEASAEEADLDVAGRDVEGLGGLLGGETFDIAEDEYKAVFFV